MFKAVVFLGSWLIPLGLFWSYVQNEDRLSKRLIKKGMEPNNPVARFRLMRALYVGAAVYAIVLLFLQAKTFRGFHDLGDLIVCTFLFSGLAWSLGGGAYHLAFAVQEFGKVDQSGNVRKTNTQWHTPIRPEAEGNHGTSGVETPEAIGLSDPDAMAEVKGRSK